MMTPAELHEIRLSLGLTLAQMGAMLGYQGKNTKQMMFDLESGKRVVREPQRRLAEAYRDGYRPKDWPS